MEKLKIASINPDEKKAQLPLISIISVNFNGEKFISDLIFSLNNLNYPKEKLEVIIVDNGSKDNSISLIKEKFPSVLLIEAKANLGFSGGNNLGFNNAKGEYFALINSDTCVHPDWLMELLKIFSLDDTIGITTSKIYFMHKPGILNNAGSQIHPDGWAGDRGYNQKDVGQFDQVEEVFCFCGASALIKRELIEEIGAFDEDFFMYFEDTDLSWRARWTGWKIFYTPKSIVQHIHCGSDFEYSPNFVYHVWRNRLLLILKNWKLSTFVKELLKFTLFLTYQGLEFGIKTLTFRRPNQYRNYWYLGMKGIFYIITRFSKFLKKRHDIFKMRKVNCNEIAKWMVRR